MARTPVTDQRDIEIGHHLRDLRDRAGISQAGLAQQIANKGTHLHATTITRIEAGTRPLSLHEAKIIARALDVDVEELAPKVTSAARTATVNSIKLSDASVVAKSLGIPLKSVNARELGKVRRAEG